jgi:hypothetical protein
MKFFDLIADSYILQIQRFEAPIEQPSSVPSLNSSSIPLQSISASLFASKSPQSGKKKSFCINI